MSLHILLQLLGTSGSKNYFLEDYLKTNEMLHVEVTSVLSVHIVLKGPYFAGN